VLGYAHTNGQRYLDTVLLEAMSVEAQAWVAAHTPAAVHDGIGIEFRGMLTTRSTRKSR